MPSARACRLLVLLEALLLVLVAAAESVPLLGYGTANIFDPAPIAHALRAGYALVDTAVLYGNHDAVRQAVEQSGVGRDKVYLVTKVGFWPALPLGPLLEWLRTRSPRVDSFLRGSKGYEAEALQRAVEELGVESVDLCLLHSPVTTLSEFLLAFVPHRIGRFGALKAWPRWLAAPTRGLLRAVDAILGGSAAARRARREASWRELEQAKRRGICRAIGVSNYALHLLEELEQYAAERPTVHELEVHPRYQPEDVLAYCRERGIHLIGYGNGVSLESDLGVVAEVAREVNRTISQVLLRWAVQQNITVIPRSATLSRISENAQLFDFELGPSALRGLGALSEGMPFYWDTSALQVSMPGRSEL